MPTTIIIFILICIYSIKSYMKKLKCGCCGGEIDTIKKIKPQDTHPDHAIFFQLTFIGMVSQKKFSSFGELS